jgi:hypothetical protein
LGEAPVTVLLNQEEGLSGLNPLVYVVVIPSPCDDVADPRPATCSECAKRITELENATVAFLKIAGERQVIANQQDSAARARLEMEYRLAGERRKSARQALLDHEASHSSPAPAASIGTSA